MAEDKKTTQLPELNSPAADDVLKSVDVSVGGSRKLKLSVLESFLLTAAKIKAALGITTLSGSNTGDETKTSIETKLDTDLVTPTSTTVFTNKRINPRIVTAASYTTNTGTALDVSTCDEFDVTAQAGALKLNNPGGTPVNGQKLIVRIKDNGTARALTYDTQFRASSDLALPTTTVLSKTLYMGFIYNSADTKWDLLAVLNNF